MNKRIVNPSRANILSLKNFSQKILLTLLSAKITCPGVEFAFFLLRNLFLFLIVYFERKNLSAHLGNHELCDTSRLFEIGDDLHFFKNVRTDAKTNFHL